MVDGAVRSEQHAENSLSVPHGDVTRHGALAEYIIVWESWVEGSVACMLRWCRGARVEALRRV
jgi:hypothetical protein